MFDIIWGQFGYVKSQLKSENSIEEPKRIGEKERVYRPPKLKILGNEASFIESLQIYQESFSDLPS
jgi:hypothetical protein